MGNLTKAPLFNPLERGLKRGAFIGAGAHGGTPIQVLIDINHILKVPKVRRGKGVL